MEFIFSCIKFVITFVHDITGGNQWLTTAIFAGLAIVCRRIPLQIFDFVMRQLTVTLRVVDDAPQDKSETIDAILLYLKKHMDGRLQRSFSVNDNASKLDERIISGAGRHYVKIFGVRAVVTLYNEKVDKGEIRRLVLKTMFWNRLKFKDMLNEVYPKDYDIPFIYSNTVEHSHAIRPVGAIPRFYGQQKQLIDPDLYKSINNIVKRFFTDDEYYKVTQKSRKETFLLYGPPGTGKTNLIRHFSSLYNAPVVLATRHSLEYVLKTLPNRNLGKVIVLIEDLVFPTQVQDSSGLENGNSGNVSKILNSLDGVIPLNDILLFITSNHIETIPPALYRPGRVDHLIPFGYPTKETVMNAIGFKENDQRFEYISKLELKEIPLDNIVSIRNSETVDDIKRVINSRDNYLKLSLNSQVVQRD